MSDWQPISSAPLDGTIIEVTNDRCMEYGLPSVFASFDGSWWRVKKDSMRLCPIGSIVVPTVWRIGKYA